MALPGIPSDSPADTKGPTVPVTPTPQIPDSPSLSYDQGVQRLLDSGSYSDPTPPTPTRDDSRPAREPEQTDVSVSQGDDAPVSENLSESDASQQAEDTPLRLDAWAQQIGLPEEHFAEQFLVPTKVNGETSDVTLKELRDSYQLGKLNRQKTSQLAQRESELSELSAQRQAEFDSRVEALQKQGSLYDEWIDGLEAQNRQALSTTGNHADYLANEQAIKELKNKRANIDKEIEESRKKQGEKYQAEYNQQVDHAVRDFKTTQSMDEGQFQQFITDAKAYLDELGVPANERLALLKSPWAWALCKDGLQSYTGRKAKAKARASDVLNIPRSSGSQPAAVTGDRQLSALDQSFQTNPTIDTATDLLLGARQRFQR